jgi:hypothetical protein
MAMIIVSVKLDNVTDVNIVLLAKNIDLSTCTNLIFPEIRTSSYSHNIA